MSGLGPPNRVCGAGAAVLSAHSDCQGSLPFCPVTRRVALTFYTLAVVLAAGGSSCPKQGATVPHMQPVFDQLPPLGEVIRVVNSNSATVHRLQARGATISAPQTPSLSADLAIERPRKIRLRAGTRLGGPELDLGSNDELFWFWVKRNQPPAVYFARHDEFYTSAARQILPVEPHWLISALGIVKLDPLGKHSGPYSAGAGRLEVRSVIPSPAGDLVRRLIIHDRYGWVLEQHLYDSSGQLMASALASHHQAVSSGKLILPRRVEIRLGPPSGMSFVIEVTDYSLNYIEGSPNGWWSPPQPQGDPLVDLADPRLQLPVGVNSASTASSAGIMGASYQPRASGRRVLR